MALMAYTEITLDCKSIDWSSGRKKKNVEGEKVIFIISVIYQHARKLQWKKLLEMAIWLKVHLRSSSSPLPFCYLTLQSNPSDSSWCPVLIIWTCNPIHGQGQLLLPSCRTTALKYSHGRGGWCSQRSPNRCFQNPEGSKAADQCRTALCSHLYFPFRSAWIN